jgi:hypothetical protein
VPDDGACLGPGQLAEHEALQILFGWMVRFHERSSWTRTAALKRLLRKVTECPTENKKE